MKDDSDFNPYAPPKEEGPAPVHPRGRPRRGMRAELREALDRLEKHVANPERMAFDRKVAGPRVRIVTWVFAALAAPFLLAGLAGLAGAGDARTPLAPIGLGLGAFLALIAVLLYVADRSMVPFGEPSSPEAALKSFLKAAPLGRFGYMWATLSPTARTQTVRTPVLGPIPTIDGESSMIHESGMKQYISSFARPGKGHIRSMAVKNISSRSVDEEVAEVDVDLELQSWPQWVTIVTAVGFAIFRPLVIVGLILLFVMRKRHRVQITKTMLRAPNGAWYVHDADLFEGAGAEARG